MGLRDASASKNFSVGANELRSPNLFCVLSLCCVICQEYRMAFPNPVRHIHIHINHIHIMNKKKTLLPGTQDDSTKPCPPFSSSSLFPSHFQTHIWSKIIMDYSDDTSNAVSRMPTGLGVSHRGLRLMLPTVGWPLPADSKENSLSGRFLLSVPSRQRKMQSV